MKTLHDLAALKKSTDLVALVQSRGIKLTKQGADMVGLCPFHDDHDPSLHVTPGKNLFCCPSCGAGGSVIDFVMKKDGLTKAQAIDWLCNQSGGSIARADSSPRGGDPTPAPAQPRVENPALFASLIAHYHEALFSRDRRGMDYLKSRGLADLATLKHFQIGFVNGSGRKLLSTAQIAEAKAIGLLNAEGNEKFYLRVVVPIHDEAGHAVGLYGRAIAEKSEVKHLYLAGGHRAVWNGAAAQAYPDELILAESILDALAIWQAGKKNVIASYGARGWTPHHDSLMEKHSVRKLVITYHDDEAGEKGTRELVSRLEATSVRVHRLRWPEGIKDACDYFQYTKALDFKGTPETFSSLLAAAPRIGTVRTGRVANARLSLVEKTEETALFQNGSVAYRVKGLSSGGSMRLVLTARKGETQHTDHLDLYASKARKMFSGLCAERFAVEPQKVEDDLLSLVELLEKLQEESRAPEAAALKPPMTDAEKAEAMTLLSSPKLLERVASDLDATGYVGERRNKELAYLIATSRRLPKPLSGIFRSQSGAGKSFLMECVAELMPPEDVHYYSRLTPQALYYLEPDALEHRLLVVDERNGSEESEYPIRTLQTRRVLKLAAPIKDPSTGKIKTVVLEIRGPIAYMESTTSARINPENANRCFELYLDESEDQTRAIFAAQRRARSLAGWKAERERARILAVHHNAQRLLRPLKVIIPYVDLIEFPTAWLRGRRDNDRLLSLIEGVAFLHQHQRRIGVEKSGVGSQEPEAECQYIEASLDDYAMAYDLAHQVFAQAASDLPQPVAEFLTRMEEAVRAEVARQKIPLENFFFRRRMIREATKLPDHLVKRHMRQIEELEYIEVRRASHGGSFAYRLMPQKKTPDVLAGLITPSALAEKWNNWNKTGTRPKTALKR